VEQPADGNLVGQFVVDLYGLRGFEDVYRYAALVQNDSLYLTKP
jgi:hypothetical protein